MQELQPSSGWGISVLDAHKMALMHEEADFPSFTLEFHVEYHLSVTETTVLDSWTDKTVEAQQFVMYCTCEPLLP